MAIIDFIRDLLFKLSPYFPAIVTTLLLAAFAVIGGLAFLLRRARERQRDAEQAEARREPRLGTRQMGDGAYEMVPEPLAALPLARSFKRAIRILKLHVGGRRYRYSAPWVLLVGPEGSGKTALAGSTGMSLPVGRPAEDLEDIRPALRWWFFDQGVLLDADGTMIRRRDGRRADQGTWRKLLSLLDRYRPQRPIDGVVLTISAADLVDSEGRPKPQDEVGHLAEALYKRLWEAQTRLGLAFPVYVLISQLDRVKGFRTFAQALSPRMRESILGWSSPYPPDAQVQPDWVDEAMLDLHRSVRGATMEIFATGAENLQDPAELLAFERAMMGLGAPLRQVVQHIFKPSAYHESFGLRGIYLSGDAGVPVDGRIGDGLGAAIYSGPKADDVTPAFLHDLFVEKIFPESGLARPARRSLLARNRTVVGAQLGTIFVLLFCGGGLWWAAEKLSRGVTSLEPFVIQVQQDIANLDRREREAAQAGGQLAGGASFGEGVAVRLLEGMTRIEIESLHIRFLPSSQFSDMSERVVDFTAEAFNRIILQSMRDGLERRAIAITENRLTNADFDEDPSEIEADQRLIDFRRYLEALNRLEVNLARYNELAQTRSIAEVRDLVYYLFGVRLSDSFVTNAGLYGQALAEVNYQPIDPNRYIERARITFDALMVPAVQGLYSDSPLLREVDAMRQQLDASTRSRQASAEELQALRGRLQHTEKLLRDPRYQFLVDRAYDPSVAEGDLLQHIERSRMLGPTRSAALLSAGRRDLETARDRLAGLRSVGLGPLLRMSQDTQFLVFSTSLADLHTGLDALFAQSFMPTERTRPLPRPAGADLTVAWNTGLLDEASDMITGFDAYRRDSLPLVPGGVQQAVLSAAADGLRESIDDRIARSYGTTRSVRNTGLRGEEALRREVEGFQDASARLGPILRLYGSLALDDSYQGLSDLILAQSLQILDTVDALFRERIFYNPRGGSFGWWDGQPGAALSAFGARDEAALADYLTSERERLRVLALDYVQPIITFLSEQSMPVSEADEATIEFWRGMTDELQRQRLRQPDSAVAALENFVLNDLMTVSAETCATAIPARSLNLPAPDYFSQRIRSLRRMVSDRCGELSGDFAISAYGAIADAFDSNLLGQYPFTAESWREGMAEATPNRLRAFYSVYDRQAPAAMAALQSTGSFGLSRDAALDFLNRMKQARDVFQGFVDPNIASDSVVLQVTPRFRVNMEAEIGGNQVIDWSINVGPDRLDHRSERGANLRWSLGEPVSVQLRWAADAVEIPAANPDDPSLSVSDRTITARYVNGWSLLALIRDHRAGAGLLPGGVDAEPHTLVFNVPTRPVAGGAPGRARLFLRVALAAQSGGEMKSVALPVFPERAPGLGLP